jgi:hypothetical protein
LAGDGCAPFKKLFVMVGVWLGSWSYANLSFYFRLTVPVIVSNDMHNGDKGWAYNNLKVGTIAEYGRKAKKRQERRIRQLGWLWQLSYDVTTSKLCWCGH